MKVRILAGLGLIAAVLSSSLASAYDLQCYNVYFAPKVAVTKNQAGQYEFKMHLRDIKMQSHDTGEGYEFSGTFNRCDVSTSDPYLLECFLGAATLPMTRDSDGKVFSKKISEFRLSTSVKTLTRINGTVASRVFDLEMLSDNWVEMAEISEMSLGDITDNQNDGEGGCSIKP